MQKYIVTVTQTDVYKKTFEIDAESMEQANELMNKQLNECPLDTQSNALQSTDTNTVVGNLKQEDVKNLIQSELDTPDEQRSDDIENLIFHELATTFKMPLDKIDEFSLLRMNSTERLQFAIKQLDTYNKLISKIK